MKKQSIITKFIKKSDKEICNNHSTTENVLFEDKPSTKSKNWIRLKPLPIKRQVFLPKSPKKRKRSDGIKAGVSDGSAHGDTATTSNRTDSQSSVVVKEEKIYDSDMNDIDIKTKIDSQIEDYTPSANLTSSVLQINTELLISPINSQSNSQGQIEEIILSDSSDDLSGIDSDETSYSPEIFKSQSNPQSLENGQLQSQPTQTGAHQQNLSEPSTFRSMSSTDDSEYSKSTENLDLNQLQSNPNQLQSNPNQLQSTPNQLQSNPNQLQSNSSHLPSSSKLLQSNSDRLQLSSVLNKKSRLNVPSNSSPLKLESNQKSLESEMVAEKSCSTNIKPDVKSVDSLELGSDNLSSDGDLEELMMSFAEEDSENDWEHVRKEIIDKTIESNNNNYNSKRLPYYLVNTKRAIHEVLSAPLDNHCFNISDLNIIHQLVSSPLDNQLLYCRLLLRNYSWIPVSKMCYDEITSSALDICSDLTLSNLLICNSQETDINALLEMLTQDDLKSICKDFKLKLDRRGEMITSLLKLSSKPSIFSSKISIKDKIISRIRISLPLCYQLSEISREVMLRIISVNSLAHRPALDLQNNPAQSLILSRLYEMSGDVKYPNVHSNRKSKLFMNREHLIQFTTAETLQTQLQIILEKKKYHEAESLSVKSMTLFTEWLENETIRKHDQSLPPYLLKFSCISMVTYAVGLSAEIYEKLRLYDKAVEVYKKLLIDQTDYGGSTRGIWWDRYCLILDHHLKQHKQAIKCIYHGLMDRFVRVGHKRGLFRRFKRITSTKKIESCFIPVIWELSYPELKSPEQREIYGMTLTRSLPGSDRVNVFVTTDHEGVTATSVEQVALDHYLKNLNFTHGVHAEGSILLTLFGLIFWDIIYNPEIPDTYFTNLQTEPLDFQTSSFYKNRKEEIKDRLQELKNIQIISDRVKCVWGDNHGVFTSLIKWELFSTAQGAIDLINCIGNSQLSLILTLFLTEFKNWRSGLPDLTVWNPHTKTYMFVEVKGPGDKLSEKQLLWFDFFVQNHFSAEVCYVKGCKRDLQTR